MYSYCSATLTEVFPCFFLSCKANARVQLAKTGHGPHCYNYIFVLFYVLFFCVVLCIVVFLSLCVLSVCKCVLYYCHRVSTQLQLTNISISINVIQKMKKICYVQQHLSDNSAVHEIEWKNAVPPDRPQMTHALCMLVN
jgi:hypothetical protein